MSIPLPGSHSLEESPREPIQNNFGLLLCVIRRSVVEAQATYDHRRIDLNEAIWFFKVLSDDLLGKTEGGGTAAKPGGNTGIVSRDPVSDLPSRRPEPNNPVDEKEFSKEPERPESTTASTSRASEASSTRESALTKPSGEPSRENSGAINQPAGKFDGREKKDEV